MVRRVKVNVNLHPRLQKYKIILQIFCRFLSNKISSAAVLEMLSGNFRYDKKYKNEWLNNIYLGIHFINLLTMPSKILFDTNYILTNFNNCILFDLFKVVKKFPSITLKYKRTSVRNLIWTSTLFSTDDITDRNCDWLKKVYMLIENSSYWRTPIHWYYKRKPGILLLNRLWYKVGVLIMAIPVVEFSWEGYKIRMVFG